MKDVPLSPDKAAARAMARDLEVTTERERAGLTTADASRHAKTPLRDHLAEWGRQLTARNNTARYVSEQTRRVERVLKGVGAVMPAELAPGPVASWLATERENETFGPATSNHVLTACKLFSGWMWREGRLPADPLQR
ncbi:MAG: hypothetical protein AAF907_14725, partial [Planctomycetota bacterium]